MAVGVLFSSTMCGIGSKYWLYKLYQYVLQMSPNSPRPYVGDVNSAFRFS